MNAFRKTWILCACIILMIVALAGPRPQKAACATKGSYSGSWSGSQTSEGMNGNGSGSITFSVNAESRTFSCTFSGSGTFSGMKNIAKVNGGVTMSGSGCSGVYSPESGAVSGTMTINETLSWTYSYTYDGETTNGSDADSKSLGAKVSGNVKKGGGTVTFKGGSLSWSVSGSGGDLYQPVKFNALSEAEKMAALEIMIGDIPEDKLLKMSDQDLQDYIDKKFAALDAGEVKNAKTQGGTDKNVQERVELAAKASEGKGRVDAAFQTGGAPSVENITHQKLVDEIRDMNEPYVREQMAGEFVKNAESEIDRLTKVNQNKKAELKKETSFVDKLKDYTSEKLGNQEAGAAVVDTAQSQLTDYATKKFEAAIEDLDTVKSMYEGGKGAMEIVENVTNMKEAFDEFEQKSQELKEARLRGDITGEQAGMIKALHIGGKAIGALADKLPIAGAGEMVESTFEAVARPALVIATLGKTRDDLVNDPNMNLEGRKMHISEMDDKPKVIERDDPTRPGKTIKYAWSEGQNCYMQIKEKKKEPDLYDWAKSFFTKKETPAHLKKYH